MRFTAMNEPEPLYDIDKVRNNFGIVLGIERRRKNMTQNSMALEAEYSPGVIAAVESGRNKREMMCLTNFLKTLNALNMTADDFLGKCQQRGQRK